MEDSEAKQSFIVQIKNDFKELSDTKLEFDIIW